MEQATGIEPAQSAWEAEILPLNYACVIPLLYSIPFFPKIQEETEKNQKNFSVSLQTSNHDIQHFVLMIYRSVSG